MSKGLATLVILSCCYIGPVQGYSVLTHEAVVDSLWLPVIRGKLMERFPGTTPEALEEAHAYVYGGCIVQDMGYYPFGSKFFSDLTHYVRSGDFIEALLRDSQTPEEYAFALGALAHYAADNNGHRIATNVSVPLLYPKLRQRFGSRVTYWDNPSSHLKTEFGFDVLQVAEGRYDPKGYRAFIGFKVSKPVLERAFADTYGIGIKDVFGNLDLALGTYRYAAGSLIPELTRAAWHDRREKILQANPNLTQKTFQFRLSRADYESAWGKEYQRPGFGVRMLTVLIRILPKVGPFRTLRFRVPTPEVEKLYFESFRATVERYRALLVSAGPAGRLQIANVNFDTGEPVVPGQYSGADLAYDKLLDKLAKQQFSTVTPELRRNLIAYYARRKGPAEKPREDHEAWARVEQEVAQLRSLDETVAATPRAAAESPRTDRAASK